MLSKNQIKLVHSLQSKKGRDKEGCFVAEGPKVVSDLMEILKPKMFFATQGWIDSNPQIDNDIVVVTDDELRKISFLQHPQGVLAVFPMLVSQPKCDFDDSSLYIALDGVQDPGNLGTIIRVADWFGITKIFCSRNTADVYNPKVVQATMGSIARVRVEYCDLQVLFDSLPAGYPVYGTFLDGEDIYKKSLTPNGFIVMGNEGNGISAAMRSRINNRLLIPNMLWQWLLPHSDFLQSGAPQESSVSEDVRLELFWSLCVLAFYFVTFIEIFPSVVMTIFTM